MAQRALALFMALVLATTLTPGFSYAEEAGTTSNSPAVENAADTSQAAGNTAAPTPSADAGTVSASGNQQKQAASSNEGVNAANNAATATGTGSGKGEVGNASTGQTGSNGTVNNAPATQDSATQAETVSATLKISVYGTTLVNHTFQTKMGKTVEDLFNEAVKEGLIDSYSHGEPYPGYTSYYVSSITIHGKKYAQRSDYSEYWASFINGEWESTGLNGTIISEKNSENGFSYEVNLQADNPNKEFDKETANYPSDPELEHPDKASGNDTTSYVKNTGNSSTVTSAPTSSSNAALAWKKNYGMGIYSDLITVGSSMFMVVGGFDGKPATLYQLDAKTGKEISSLKLFSSIDYTCRPVYTDGVIVIPLANGRLQGVSATEMKTLWVSNAIAAGDKNMSTVTAANGMVFTGTTSDWDATKGTFFGINAITGDCVWANKNEEAGYYWAGACKIGNVLIYGDNAGWLKAVDPATGKVVSQLKLSSAIRSTVISNEAGTKAYVTTNDGTLHALSVAIDGSLSEQNSVLDSSKALCTSTPTLFEGNLYVGGGVYGDKGYFSVIDASTLQVKSTIEVPYYVQSTPLVAKAADDKTYAYFTCNGAETDENKVPTNGGGAWVYCLETNTATKLFEATGDAANYCNKSITMGADGALYWTNDSGTLFALASKASFNNGNNGGADNKKEDDTGKKTSTTPQNSTPQTKGGNGSTGSAPATHAPLSTAELQQNNDNESTATAEDEQPSDSSNVETTSAASARNASTDSNSNQQQIPWAPIAGIVVGCAGLIGVGTYLFRRRQA